MNRDVNRDVKGTEGGRRQRNGDFLQSPEHRRACQTRRCRPRHGFPREIHIAHGGNRRRRTRCAHRKRAKRTASRRNPTTNTAARGTFPRLLPPPPPKPQRAAVFPSFSLGLSLQRDSVYVHKCGQERQATRQRQCRGRAGRRRQSAGRRRRRSRQWQSRSARGRGSTRCWG